MKNLKQKAVLAAMLLLSSTAAMADVSAALEAVEADISSFASAGWGFATAVVVALTGIKLFKKFVGRAT
ncbi:Phage major coat protein, Gp8 [Rheinheimera pacifica]|uniref:Phage major coat protein, Gp8 n=1 Tax=Rheinheimera pacifica TaxID=173990 RepID=A0A1H6M5D4_9GAMM|nr:major coat protein [Rheinheimera pacifica]SEH96528.1 Phage major coat protein, Gp8 [Rheinheimera pacifica]